MIPLCLAYLLCRNAVSIHDSLCSQHHPGGSCISDFCCSLFFFSFTVFFFFLTAKSYNLSSTFVLLCFNLPKLLLRRGQREEKEWKMMLKEGGRKGERILMKERGVKWKEKSGN